LRIGIIGAGPAGLTAAYELAGAGHEVSVFEGAAVVGGMARSHDLWGQRVDLGPHRFFSGEARVNRLWLEIVGADYRTVRRQTRILYRGRLYDYPLSAGNALGNMGLLEASLCVLSYLRARVASPVRFGSQASFEEWVVSRFGRRLYEMFFRSYSEKLWGIPCHELNADFAAQRIRSFSLAQALLAMAGLGETRHRTLADAFMYPKNGNGDVYERMAEAIGRRGGSIRLGTAVESVTVRDGRAVGIELADGTKDRFDRVISTMPLPAMVGRIAGVPEGIARAARALSFRNTIVVYLLVGNDALFPDQWLYVHSPELGMGRVTNFRNWAPEITRGRRETILAVEYWCGEEDAIWSEPEASLVARARAEIAASGLAKESEVLEGRAVRVPRCYPVYARDYRRHLDPVVDYLRSIGNLQAIGRYGAFKYNNQDHSILMGMLAADAILGRNPRDLWSVNADDAYQEGAPAAGEAGS